MFVSILESRRRVALSRIIDAETIATAGDAQRELARTGRHRVPIPDLLIAACAQQHAGDVVRVDRHFELLASMLHCNSIRL